MSTMPLKYFMFIQDPELYLFENLMINSISIANMFMLHVHVTTKVCCKLKEYTGLKLRVRKEN